MAGLLERLRAGDIAVEGEEEEEEEEEEEQTEDKAKSNASIEQPKSLVTQGEDDEEDEEEEEEDDYEQQELRRKEIETRVNKTLEQIQAGADNSLVVITGEDEEEEEELPSPSPASDSPFSKEELRIALPAARSALEKRVRGQNIDMREKLAKRLVFSARRPTRDLDPVCTMAAESVIRCQNTAAHLRSANQHLEALSIAARNIGRGIEAFLDHE